MFVAVWTIAPAPNRPLLVISVGARELAPWLLSLAVIIGALALRLRRCGALGWLAATLAGSAALIFATRLVGLPATSRDLEAAMHAAFGADYLQTISPDRRLRLRPTPVAGLDIFRGVDVGQARVTRDVAVASPHGVPLTADIYQPMTSGSYPTVVQIYGGAWQHGTPGDDGAFATYLASHGFVVFAIDYRHAPEWTWPAQRDDVREAMAWVRAHARQYEADGSRLALVGRSAGGHLALLAAYERDGEPVSAVVSYYGPVDLTAGYRHPPVPDPLDGRRLDEAFLGGTPDDMPDRYAAASPITHVSPQSPPTLLIQGADDHVVAPQFAARLQDALRAAGVRSALLEIPHAEHSFDVIFSGPSGQLSLYYTERFLAWALTR